MKPTSVWIATLLVGALLAALFLVRPSRLQIGTSLLIPAAWIVLVLIDQHRLQPWAYEFAIVGVILALTRSSLGLRLLRILVISIYLYSALA